MKSIFSGTGVALVTPFDEKNAIDFPALEKLIDFNIANGINYLVSLGTTGETATLTKEEKNEIWRFTVQVIKGRVPLVAGIGGNNTAEMVHLLETTNMEGFNAILSVSPSYNKPQQEGIFQHYKAIADVSPLPVIIYNVPGRTASNINADTLLRIAALSKKFIGVKEASGNFSQIMQIIKNKAPEFLVISGDDNITLPLIAAGCDGVISVAANCFPKDFSAMVDLALQNKMEDARNLQYKLLDGMDLLFAEGSPAGAKAALFIKGICKMNVRLPIVPATDSLVEKLRIEIQKNNL